MALQMSGGTYIINGGTFSIQGGSTVTSSGGVLIYLTGGATVNIANGATVTLSAQASGSLSGRAVLPGPQHTVPRRQHFRGRQQHEPYGLALFSQGHRQCQ